MWWDENRKCGGIENENMMEWKLKMWRNEIVKYDGIHCNEYETIHEKLWRLTFFENGVVYFSVIQDI